jgi:hypothetical protein
MIAALDPAHPLLRLATEIDWTDRRLLGERRLAGAHLLTLLRGLHDEDLVEQWPENPYFQAFCGESVFAHACPFTPETLASWRDSISAAVLDAWTAAALPNAPAAAPRTFVIDVDGVVATLTLGNDYKLAQPISATIAAINRLYDRGHTIIMLTARGSATGLSWEEVTRDQFKRWGLKYHDLRFGKPAADHYIDDRLISVERLRSMAAGLPFPPSSRAPGLSVQAESKL